MVSSRRNETWSKCKLQQLFSHVAVPYFFCFLFVHTNQDLRDLQGELLDMQNRKGDYPFNSNRQEFLNLLLSVFCDRKSPLEPIGKWKIVDRLLAASSLWQCFCTQRSVKQLLKSRFFPFRQGIFPPGKFGLTWLVELAKMSAGWTNFFRKTFWF